MSIMSDPVVDNILKNIQQSKQKEYINPYEFTPVVDLNYSPNASTLIFMLFFMFAACIGFVISYSLKEDLNKNVISHGRTLGYVISASIYAFSIFYIIIHTLPKTIFYNNNNGSFNSVGIGLFIIQIFSQFKSIIIHLFINMFHYTTFLISLLIFIFIVLSNYEILKIKMNTDFSIISNVMKLFITNLFLYFVLLAITIILPTHSNNSQITSKGRIYDSKMGMKNLTLLNMLLIISSVLNSIFIVFIYIHCNYYITDDLIDYLKQSS